MTDEVAQALLVNVVKDATAERIVEIRNYFRTMAKYKYDAYQQYSPGMRFIERFSLWLNQFQESDKEAALRLVKEKLIFISAAEMNLLVSSAFPDVIRELFIEDAANEIDKPSYLIKWKTHAN